MLKKRIIPCLDIKDGRVVKGINFINLRDAGSPSEVAKTYYEAGADELVLLDITASSDNRKIILDVVRNVAKNIFIPFCVGGGINKIEDIKAILDAGADKVSINSSAVKNKNLIKEASMKYGSQCIVVAIDTKFNGKFNEVYIHGGRTPTGLDTLAWAREVESLGAGEILLTSMDSDGTKDGYDIDITKLVADNVNIPVIASGGAGKIEDFYEVFRDTKATGALAASVFHYHEVDISQLKKYLNQNNISIRIEE